MKQIIIYTMLLMLVMPVAMATEIYQPNTFEVLKYNCWDESTGLYIDSIANITIRYPNNTIHINHSEMFSYDTGQFSFNHTTENITGVYGVDVLCEKVIDGTKARGGFVYQIKDFEEETGLTSVAFVLGLGLFIGIILYVVMNLDDKKHPELVFLKILTMFFVIFLTILIPKLALDILGPQSQTALAFFKATTWFIRAFVTFWFLFFIYKLFSKFEIITKVIDRFRQ